MEQFHLIQGRQLREPDLAAIRCLIASHPDWSRRRISVELAQTWSWRTSTGQLKDMAARSLLLKLEQRDMLTLPPCRQKATRRAPLTTVVPDNERVPAGITEPLTALQPVRLEAVTARSPDYAIVSRYLARHHYLGFRGPVGENMAYLARDRHGRDLACLLFGATAWKTKPRDRRIGWDDATRARRLQLVANNSRFLILPWVRVPHLASHLLGCIARRLPSIGRHDTDTRSTWSKRSLSADASTAAATAPPTGRASDTRKAAPARTVPATSACPSKTSTSTP